jgi:hypothetical protein
MLEEFREEANKGTDFNEGKEDQDIYSFETPSEPQGQFLGMSPAQRFLIAILILLIACLLSTFCLLVTQKIVPPFL